MSLWRRFRGAAGVTISWAVAWALATLLFTCAWWLVTFPAGLLQRAALLEFLRQAGMAGIVGGVVGTGFSVYLAAQRRDLIRSLSIPRLMIAGAFAALAMFTVILWWFGALPMLAHLSEWPIPAGILAALGAASGGGTLALARRAPANAMIDGEGTAAPQVSSSN